MFVIVTNDCIASPLHVNKLSVLGGFDQNGAVFDISAAPSNGTTAVLLFQVEHRAESCIKHQLLGSKHPNLMPDAEFSVITLQEWIDYVNANFRFVQEQDC